MAVTIKQPAPGSCAQDTAPDYQVTVVLDNSSCNNLTVAIYEYDPVAGSPGSFIGSAIFNKGAGLMKNIQAATPTTAGGNRYLSVWCPGSLVSGYSFTVSATCNKFRGCVPAALRLVPNRPFKLGSCWDDGDLLDRLTLLIFSESKDDCSQWFSRAISCDKPDNPGYWVLKICPAAQKWILRFQQGTHVAATYESDPLSRGRIRFPRSFTLTRRGKTRGDVFKPWPKAFAVFPAYCQ
jgi:hypothetical protein